MKFKGDLFGGITAAVVALPLSLAFGVTSGLGAAAGLYGAIILGFFASLFGGTPAQVSGPTGPMTVVFASATVLLHHNINLLVSVILLAGAFQLCFAYMNLGKFVKYIPYPVLSGFMTGIGCIIIIIQINPLLGQQNNVSVLEVLSAIPEHLQTANLDAVYIGAMTLAIMFLTPMAWRRLVPTPLIALLVLTPVSVYGPFDLITIGTIPQQLPSWVTPAVTWVDLKVMLSMGLTLALLGTIDTLLTSVVADSMTQTKHDSKKELVGQGIGNMLCALVGALPGAGATMRTATNIKSGGTTRYSGMIHALFLLLTLLFLAPYAEQIPMALLAGILIKVGVDIFDYRFIKSAMDVPKSDLLVMVSVLLVTVLVDLITAVALGMVIASLMIVYKLTKDTQVLIQQESVPNIPDKNVDVIKINGAFFFGSSQVFENDVQSLEQTQQMVLDFSDSLFMDVTAIFMLQELVKKLIDNGTEVHMVMKERHRNKIIKLKMNLDPSFSQVQFHDSLANAIKEAAKNEGA